MDNKILQSLFEVDKDCMPALLQDLMNKITEILINEIPKYIDYTKLDDVQKDYLMQHIFIESGYNAELRLCEEWER